MLFDHVEKLLHEIAKTEKFIDYNIKKEPGSNHGDNYLGVLIAVTISGNKYENGIITPEKLHLICKFPPDNEVRKESFKSTILFKRELVIYSELLPDFVRFQKEKGLSGADLFLSFPKTYACEMDEATDRYIIIMEDLRAKNYEMLPRDVLCSLDHELLVLRELGKFHAISFAMKDQRPNHFKRYEQLKDLAIHLFHGPFEAIMNEAIEKAASVLENPQHIQFMQNYRNTYAKTIVEFLSCDPSKEFGVIGHGDYHTMNLLFQYADVNNKEVKSVSILDWQISRYCPPVFDVLYHIFSSTDRTFRKQHYDELLTEYYSALSENIRKLGSDPEKLYSFTDFQNQLRKFSEFALMTCPFLILFKVAKTEDIGNLDEYAEHLENDGQSNLISSFNKRTQSKYSRLINDLVTDFVDYGYIKVGTP